ncbi:hypothetical protein DUNSADRAFT_1929 [Dunaliella salina]|uniref:Encoded protein n=1 Tax=Dunaliella salina TaxID=3046 RepID=A0ABQ7FWU4_DUNSA|nr:hypothetical protein DUNSADRAFT_1929 [Dunaliella salina]|eukprot:KAF5826833.1 hypothetical protein DUNSADRAFT_1929 [Dunaliella salina]
MTMHLKVTNMSQKGANHWFGTLLKQHSVKGNFSCIIKLQISPSKCMSHAGAITQLRIPPRTHLGSSCKISAKRDTGCKLRQLQKPQTSLNDHSLLQAFRELLQFMELPSSSAGPWVS